MLVPASRKLNVGSGPHYAPGWFNVDLYAEDADLIADARDLSVLPDDHFERVYLGHVLEHLPYDDIPTMFEELRRVSVDKALVAVVGPAYDKALETLQPKWLVEQIKQHEYEGRPGAGHAWTATTRLTLEALHLSPLEDVREVRPYKIKQPEWPNPSAAVWQVAAVARFRAKAGAHAAIRKPQPR